MRRPRLTRRTLGWWLTITLLAFAVAEGCYRAGLLNTVDHLYSDAWHQLAGPRSQPRHVVLVTVDDQALAAQADTPLVFWTPQFARAAEVLHTVGARAVALDFLPATTPENWLRRIQGLEASGLRDYDLPFRQTLSHGRLLLVATHAHNGNTGQDSLLLPHPDYLLSLPNFDLPHYVGFADLQADADGGIRRFVVRPALRLPSAMQAGAPELSLPALLAQHLQPNLPMQDGWIQYAGPPGTVPTLSIARLLASDAVHDPTVRALAGKLVIIGARFQGMGDLHGTPYQRSLPGHPGRLMSGAEIQANVVETLLANNPLRPLETDWRWTISALLLATAAALFLRLSPWKGLALLLVGILLPVGLGYALFGADRILPVAPLQAALLTAGVAAQGRRLSREAREKRHIRQVFSRYVSDEVVDLVLDADRPPDLGGTTAEVTVLFSDIRNFTTLAERLSAPETVELLNAYFERVCAPVLDNAGSIDKFIGDAIMVQFGAPLPYADHARRAVRTALAIRDAAADFAGWVQQRFPGRDLPPFAIGIGLHTGPAVVGNVGCSRRMEFTTIGDTVNLAARLESATKELGCVILASRDTCDAAGPRLRTGQTRTLTVKGRAQPVEVFEILDDHDEEPSCAPS